MLCSKCLVYLFCKLIFGFGLFWCIYTLIIVIKLILTLTFWLFYSAVIYSFFSFVPHLVPCLFELNSILIKEHQLQMSKIRNLWSRLFPFIWIWFDFHVSWSYYSVPSSLNTIVFPAHVHHAVIFYDNNLGQWTWIYFYSLLMSTVCGGGIWQSWCKV